MLQTDGSQLGVGRDVRQHARYDNLRLACAWRLEHPAMWEKYFGGTQQVVRDVQLLRRQGVRPPRSAPVRTEAAARGLPGSLNAEANEAMLLHGTKPEVLLNIISTGMNERFSGGLFGHGTYLAEDVGKNDQYVTCDDRFDSDESTPLGALHKRLYHHRSAQHPGRVFYVLVCRVCAARPHPRSTSHRRGGFDPAPSCNFAGALDIRCALRTTRTWTAAALSSHRVTVSSLRSLV